MSEQKLVSLNEMQLDPNDPREREILIVEREFSVTQRKAMALSQSNLVPAQFHGNVANCMIAMEMANRLGTGDMEIMQNLYVVHGNPAFSSKYLIALVNRSGVIKGRLKFRFVGEQNKPSWGCQAYAICSETGEELTGTTITMEMAQKEGWSSKKGSKWITMPEQMLMYRAASFWSRIYAPDATMGFHTREEIEESEIKDITPKSSTASTISSEIKPAIPDASTAPEADSLDEWIDAPESPQHKDDADQGLG